MKNKIVIFDKIKAFFSDKTKVVSLSLSFFLLSIFLVVIVFISPEGKSKDTRTTLSSFCFLAGFYLIPIANMKQKDRIFMEIGKCILSLSFGMSSVLYYVSHLDEDNTTLISDIIALVFFVSAFYYFIRRFFLIVKVFIAFVSSLTTKLFPNSASKPGGFKFIFERFTAILISISGALGTILAIATTIKAIINMFTG